MQLELTLTKQVRNAHYHALNPNGSKARILAYLETVPDATNKEIARALRLDINQVTGRVFELRQEGRVTLSCLRLDLSAPDMERRLGMFRKTRESCAWKLK